MHTFLTRNRRCFHFFRCCLCRRSRSPRSRRRRSGRNMPSRRLNFYVSNDRDWESTISNHSKWSDEGRSEKFDSFKSATPDTFTPWKFWGKPPWSRKSKWLMSEQVIRLCRDFGCIQQLFRHKFIKLLQRTHKYLSKIIFISKKHVFAMKGFFEF